MQECKYCLHTLLCFARGSKAHASTKKTKERLQFSSDDESDENEDDYI